MVAFITYFAHFQSRGALICGIRYHNFIFFKALFGSCFLFTAKKNNVKIKRNGKTLSILLTPPPAPEWRYTS